MEQPDASLPEREVRIRLAPRFTAEGVAAIHLLLDGLLPGTRVDLDFSGVRECQEEALLLLAREVQTGRGRFVLRGVTRHQARLFGYLGVPVQQPEEEGDR
jgi:hypothetical protein